MKRILENTIIKKAVIYCRVSTKEQVEEGSSLKTQETLCKDYAFKHGYEIVQTFIEEGESAKTANRTQWQKLLQFCSVKRNNISAVIAYKLDRISRNTDDYSQIRILLKRYGVEIKSTSEHLEDTPAGRFMENIIANVAQFDNDVRTERTTNGMKEAVREGRYVWQAPIGYRNTRVEGKATIEKDVSAYLVAELFDLVSKSIGSLEMVRQLITEKGLRNKTGQILGKSQLYRLLRNELYAGWITQFGERNKGHFESIVSEAKFAVVQDVLSGKSTKKYAYNIQNPDFPLRRFVSHNNSKRPATGAWSQGKRLKYSYYIFRGIKGVVRARTLHHAFKDFFNQFILHPSAIEKFRGFIHKYVVEHNHNLVYKGRFLRSQLQDLEKLEIEMFEKNAAGNLSDDILTRKFEILKKKKLDLMAQLEDVPDNAYDEKQVTEFFEEYLRAPGNVWLKADYRGQQELQWFNFPDGVTFDGKICRTPKVGGLYKDIFRFYHNFSSMVTHRHSKLNKKPIKLMWEGNKMYDVLTVEQKHQYWTDVSYQVTKLAEILKRSQPLL